MPRDPVAITLAAILALTMLAWLFGQMVKAIARREINHALRGYIVTGILKPPRDKRGRFKRV